MTPRSRTGAPSEEGHGIAAEILSAARKSLTRGPGGYVQLIVTRKRAPRTESIRAWPGGPLGIVVGEVSPGRWMLDVLAADLLRKALPAPTAGDGEGGG